MPFIKTHKKNFLIFIASGLGLLWLSVVIFQSCTSEKKETSEKQTINGGVYNNRAYLTSEASFVGSKACQSCHEKEFKNWKGSDHELGHDGSRRQHRACGLRQ